MKSNCRRLAVKVKLFPMEIEFKVSMKKPAAINYYKNSMPFYRSRCDSCVRKNKKTKSSRIPRKIVADL